MSNAFVQMEKLVFGGNFCIQWVFLTDYCDLQLNES